VLIRRKTLELIGGIESIRNSLIDDVALAKAAKVFGPIFLGHSNLASSIRPYPRFADIWHMITRTAYTQLRYSLRCCCSPWAASCSCGGPAAAILFGHGKDLPSVSELRLSAAVTSDLLRYRRNPLWALALPAIAAFYMAATWFGHEFLAWTRRRMEEPRLRVQLGPLRRERRSVSPVTLNPFMLI